MSQSKASQDYQKLYDQQMKWSQLFVDLQFRPKIPYMKFNWCRPRQICESPQFVAQSLKSLNIEATPDCFSRLSVAFAMLKQNAKLFDHVVPKDIGCEFGDLYAGIYRFRFWRFGKEEEIVIDDKLHNVEAKLVFMKEPNYEFWQPLAEKAYAKFLKSYETIKEVQLNDMFVDLSGCIVESYSVDEAPADLFKIIVKSLERGSHVGISVCRNSLLPGYTPCKGIVNHAFSITRAETVQINCNEKSIQVVGIKNLLTRRMSLNVPIIDKSPTWKLIPEKAQNEIRQRNNLNGEITIKYVDFLEKFDQISLFHVPGEFVNTDKKWKVSTYTGQMNCSTLFKLDCPDSENQCTIVVSLMQKNLEDLTKSYPAIKFEIYEAENKLHNDSIFKKLVDFNEFETSREVVKRLKLPPGCYAITPRSRENLKDGDDCLIRVFSESKKPEVIMNPKSFLQAMENFDLRMTMPMPIISASNVQSYCVNMDVYDGKFKRQDKMLKSAIKLVVFGCVIMSCLITVQHFWNKF